MYLWCTSLIVGEVAGIGVSGGIWEISAQSFSEPNNTLKKYFLKRERKKRSL